MDYTTTMALADVDAEYFKRVYLPGFTFFGADGQQLPKEFFEEHLRDALARIEQTTQIDIIPKCRKNEQHDFKFTEWADWGFLQLFHYPLTSVQQLRFRFPSSVNAVQIFPPEWLRLLKSRSQISLVPTPGATTGIIVGPGFDWVPWAFGGYYSDIPQAWEVDYTTGFDPENVPRLITQTIAKLAAVDIFSELSDMIRPLGITSESLSVDGLSQSRGFLTPAFKARIDGYKEDLWGPLSRGGGLIDQIMDTYGVIPLRAM